ncbi:MAG: hypothetical protein K6T81_19185 [Alicyclobacillus macrosporangiidus]|uniref:hypothetical protein n=1 Tax=Alicyclobacillus macrosporangiidus TaxID=392015 RepID=UPI0026EF114E|nr:hypothetical protein [Alicyclobacillus macrosporangiidus]MCL6600835.1 hypothetical protein [Alicyclobacillus macrosporangiidus]
MGRKKIMINAVIDDVKFQNLPVYINSEGKILYPLNSWAVAELVASKIDKDVKPYVTVDFTTVDVQRFLDELNSENASTPIADEDAEAKLLSYIFGDETADQ